MYKFSKIAILLILILPAIAEAQFSSSTTFQIQAGVVDSSGGYSSSTSFQLFGNIPYIETGNTSSSNFQINAGFPFANSVSAFVISSGGTGTAGGAVGGYFPTQTSTSTDIISYIAILQSLMEQASALLIQQGSRPSLITDLGGKIPIEISDLFDGANDLNVGQRKPIDLNYKQLPEIYKKLIQTRFIPALIVLVIVILIFFRRRK